MAPSLDSEDPERFEGGAFLADLSPTQATAVPTPRLPPLTHPQHLHPQGRGQFADSAPRRVQLAMAAVQSRSQSRFPAVVMGTERRFYGGRRDPNPFSPPHPPPSRILDSYAGSCGATKGRLNAQRTPPTCCDFRQGTEPR